MKTPITFRTMPLFFVSAVLAVASVACSDGGGTTPPGNTNDSGAGNDAAAQNDTGTTSDGGVTPGEPATVDITFGTCSKVTPCGGGVVGTWDYTGVCADNPWAAFKQQCPSATVTNQKGTVKGRVVFDATTVKRTSTVTFSATIDVPAQCSAGQCGAVQTALAKYADKVTCKTSGAGCACDLALSQSAAETNGYTIAGNTVNIADGSTYDYCVSGSKLGYVPGGSSKEQDGAYEMTKK